jgi:hypothetical protein
MGIRKRGIITAAAVIAVGTAVGVATLAASTAHAQSSSSITITGVAPATGIFGPESFIPLVTVSITCPADDVFWVNASTVQGATSIGNHSGLATCTGSAETVTVTTGYPSNSGAASPGVGAGPVFVGATLVWNPQGNGDGSAGYQYVGTTANLTFP